MVRKQNPASKSKSRFKKRAFGFIAAGTAIGLSAAAFFGGKHLQNKRAIAEREIQRIEQKLTNPESARTLRKIYRWDPRKQIDFEIMRGIGELSKKTGLSQERIVHNFGAQLEKNSGVFFSAEELSKKLFISEASLSRIRKNSNEWKTQKARVEILKFLVLNPEITEKLKESFARFGTGQKLRREMQK